MVVLTEECEYMCACEKLSLKSQKILKIQWEMEIEFGYYAELD